MSNPLLLSMLKNFIGPEQLASLELLTNELLKTLQTVNEMNERQKRIEAYLLLNSPVIIDAKSEPAEIDGSPVVEKTEA